MIKKDAKNNYGVKGASAPDASFFEDLARPTDPDWATQAKKVFYGAEKVKVTYVGI